MYIGHKREDGCEQSLQAHNEEVAAKAQQFAAPFGADAYAYQTGLAHDIGKYSPAGQRRQRGEGPKVDHSTAGAVELRMRGMLGGALCVAGHHGGLPDLGHPRDISGPTLMGRMHKQLTGALDYHAYEQELALTPIAEPRGRALDFDYGFWVRMLYSCLVDADFLNTEEFMQDGQVQRGKYDPLPVLLERLNGYIDPWWQPKRDINKKRCEILRRCLAAAADVPGLFTLSVPTGGGKTVASLAFALTHAIRHRLERVIYVVPYTSIIEQTADTFRKILGAENVLEHHSNISYRRDQPGNGSSYAADEDEAAYRKWQLACENWDAPVIVTTNVQFFESLFANRSAKCRKIHHIARSVVIFDEAQMLPLHYLLPCVRSMELLVREYGASVLLCTATQPSLGKFFRAGISVSDICPPQMDLYHAFRRTTLKPIGRQDTAAIADLMMKKGQALAIVNTRKQAGALYHALPQGEGTFCLTTFRCPHQRRQVIDQIKYRLKEGLPCLVAATSLIEAGVDVDFPLVLREQAGLDAILQAAGRCNREGKNPREESLVYIFSTDVQAPSMLARQAEVFAEIAREYPDLAGPEAIKAYFDRLHDVEAGMLDILHLIERFDVNQNQGNALPFATLAAQVHLIEAEQTPILIPYEQEGERIAAALRRGEVSRALLRQAAPYLVSVYDRDFAALYQAGAVEMTAGKMAILTDLSRYDAHTGLCVEEKDGAGIFI